MYPLIYVCRNFLDLIQSLGEVGNKYEDYSTLTCQKVTSSLQQCMDKLVMKHLWMQKV